MIVSFGTARLKHICLVLSEAEVALGTVNAKELITMIADIEAHEHSEELLNFMNDIAHIGPDDTIEIAFGLGCSASFAPVGQKFQRSPEGRVLWSTVERLKLIEIEGCDGSR